MLVHRQRLAALHTLDGVIDLKVGDAALEAYQTNDRHVQVVQSAAALCEHVVAVDFEI